MPVVTCPAWEYKDVPGSASLLADRTRAILIWLHTLSLPNRVAHVRDTRPLHEKTFDGLTPPSFAYYAGHYRGENFLCLLHYEVGIEANPLVGKRPELVASAMRAFDCDVSAVLASLDILWPVPERIISKPVKLRRTAELVAALFNSFLLIHPYANGNGHMARFIAVATLSRYGLRPRQWPIHPRPPDPPYSALIASYQHGDTEGFIKFLLKCL